MTVKPTLVTTSIKGCLKKNGSKMAPTCEKNVQIIIETKDCLTDIE
jgi:hypothetical protein